MDSGSHTVGPAQTLPRTSANGSSNPNGAPNLTSTTQLSPPIPIASSAQRPQPEHGPNAILTGIYVVLIVYLGLVVAYLPWTEAWTQNSLLLRFPAVRAFLGSNFTRGVVSGIGLVDIWMGVSEAVSYRARKD
jgi:hypothetical protein